MQVAARCEQFEGGVEGDPGLVIEGDPGLVIEGDAGLVRQDLQSSWEGLPAEEGLNVVQIYRIWTNSFYVTTDRQIRPLSVKLAARGI